MMLGTVIWLVFHVLFLIFGMSMGNYSMMLVMYGIRGLGYPLFLYAFLVWVTYITDKTRLATAIGWFWAMYSVGMGVIGTYLPSFTIPYIGFMGTLWMSLIWIIIGGVIAYITVGKHDVRPNAHKSTKERFITVLSEIGVVYKNPNIIKVFIVRIINQLSLFGLVVIFLLYLLTILVSQLNNGFGFGELCTLHVLSVMLLGVLSATELDGNVKL